MNITDGSVSTWSEYPSPVGLFSGFAGVIIGQVLILLYHYYQRTYGKVLYIQKEEKPRDVPFLQGALGHVGRLEGFVMLGSYLSLTWMFKIMPDSYYQWEGGVSLMHLAMQILINDTMQTLMHFGEHKISRLLYGYSHKMHHRFTNPQLFDAFDGSPGDTFLMIIVPLLVTAQCVHCNVWSYIAFGSTYAGWLTLLHSEYHHPWDKMFRKLGLGTAGDHHVHHKQFVYNYGHLVMWLDMLLGTYKHPDTIKGFTVMP